MSLGSPWALDQLICVLGFSAAEGFRLAIFWSRAGGRSYPLGWLRLGPLVGNRDTLGTAWLLSARILGTGWGRAGRELLAVLGTGPYYPLGACPGRWPVGKRGPAISGLSFWSSWGMRAR